MKKSEVPPMPGKMPEEIEFKYIFSDDYNPLYVNGAFGGVSSKKEIVVNFYLERIGIPNSQRHKLGPDGKLGDEIERTPATDHLLFVRVVKNGVVLSLESAKVINKWLDQRIQELEKLEGHNVLTGEHS
jgi:hypothetical protein